MTELSKLRSLVIVLGDQLDHDAAAFDDFDAAQDAVWMAEVAEESEHVWSSKPRIAMFLSAMRHFAAELRARGVTVHYTRLDDAGNAGTLAGDLAAAIARLKPAQLVMTASSGASRQMTQHDCTTSWSEAPRFESGAARFESGAARFESGAAVSLGGSGSGAPAPAAPAPAPTPSEDERLSSRSAL